MASAFKKALSKWAGARIAAEQQKTASGQVSANQLLNKRFSILIREMMKPQVSAKDMEDLLRLERWTVDPAKVKKMKETAK